MAKWHGTPPAGGWYRVTVQTRGWDRYPLEQGVWGVRPDWTRKQLEMRIARDIGIAPKKLIIRVLG